MKPYLEKIFKKKILTSFILIILAFNFIQITDGLKTNPKSASYKNNLDTEYIENYDYLVITTDYLEESITFFKNWKEYIGYSVKIVNTTWIYSNYEGIDNQEIIRNFLIDKYILWGLKYLLMVGDINEIPMRYCCYNSTNEHAIPTDYYYADLTSNWDSNGNGIYAEFSEDENPDFTAEIFVGRIPCNNPVVLKNIFKNIIEFEHNTELWKKNVLLIGSITNYENEVGLGQTKTDGAVLMEKLWNDIYFPNGYYKTTMYEKEGLRPSIYDCDYNLNQENIISNWQKGFGLVNWASHGNIYDSYRKIWEVDLNINNIPDLNEIQSKSFISSSDSNSISTGKPSIVFSCSCSNSYPEDSNNLGKTLIQDGAAVIFIGATRLSYYYYGWNNANDGGSMTIDYYFFENLIKNNNTCGESFYKTLSYCWDEDKISVIYENMFVFSLYGDPSLSLNTFKSPSIPNIPDKPNGLDKINSLDEFDYYTTTSNKDNNNFYYLWDWGDSIDYELMGPFDTDEICIANHKWEIPGSYRIRVKSINIIGDESSWSEPILINVEGPILIIDSITGGIKLNFEIKNIGNLQADNVQWNITLVGGTIFTGRYLSGTIDNIPFGEKTTIVTNLIFGFANPTIAIIQAGINNTVSDKKAQLLEIVLFYIKIK